MVEQGAPAAARVEVAWASHRSWVPDDALAIAGDRWRFPLHNWVGSGRRRTLRSLSPVVPDASRGTDTFCVDGSVRQRLPPGTNRITALRGPETRLAQATVEVRASEPSPPPWRTSSTR